MPFTINEQELTNNNSEEFNSPFTDSNIPYLSEFEFTFDTNQLEQYGWSIEKEYLDFIQQKAKIINLEYNNIPNVLLKKWKEHKCKAEKFIAENQTIPNKNPSDLREFLANTTTQTDSLDVIRRARSLIEEEVLLNNVIGYVKSTKNMFNLTIFWNFLEMIALMFNDDTSVINPEDKKNLQASPSEAFNAFIKAVPFPEETLAILNELKNTLKGKKITETIETLKNSWFENAHYAKLTCQELCDYQEKINIMQGWLKEIISSVKDPNQPIGQLEKAQKFISNFIYKPLPEEVNRSLYSYLQKLDQVFNKECEGIQQTMRLRLQLIEQSINRDSSSQYAVYIQELKKFAPIENIKDFKYYIANQEEISQELLALMRERIFPDSEKHFDFWFDNFNKLKLDIEKIQQNEITLDIFLDNDIALKKHLLTRAQKDLNKFKKENVDFFSGFIKNSLREKIKSAEEEIAALDLKFQQLEFTINNCFLQNIIEGKVTENQLSHILKYYDNNKLQQETIEQLYYFTKGILPVDPIQFGKNLLCFFPKEEVSRQKVKDLIVDILNKYFLPLLFDEKLEYSFDIKLFANFFCIYTFEKNLPTDNEVVISENNIENLDEQITTNSHSLPSQYSEKINTVDDKVPEKKMRMDILNQNESSFIIELQLKNKLQTIKKSRFKKDPLANLRKDNLLKPEVILNEMRLNADSIHTKFEGLLNSLQPSQKNIFNAHVTAHFTDNPKKQDPFVTDLYTACQEHIHYHEALQKKCLNKIVEISGINVKEKELTTTVPEINRLLLVNTISDLLKQEKLSFIEKVKRFFGYHPFRKVLKVLTNPAWNQWSLATLQATELDRIMTKKTRAIKILESIKKATTSSQEIFTDIGFSEDYTVPPMTQSVIEQNPDEFVFVEKPDLIIEQVPYTKTTVIGEEKPFDNLYESYLSTATALTDSLYKSTSDILNGEKRLFDNLDQSYLSTATALTDSLYKSTSDILNGEKRPFDNLDHSYLSTATALTDSLYNSTSDIQNGEKRPVAQYRHSFFSTSNDSTNPLYNSHLTDDSDSNLLNSYCVIEQTEPESHQNQTSDVPTHGIHR